MINQCFEVQGSIGSWVAFDMESEPDSAAITQDKTAIIKSSNSYNNDVTSQTSEHPETQIHRITTFAYDDSYGNTKAIDIIDFAGCQNPSKELAAPCVI
jgi:hypothetical protein